jgi:malonate transporter
MRDLLLLFLPFFALLLLGWGAARGGLLLLEGIGTLNTFVLFFALPAMVFRLAASGALHQPGLGGLLLAYGLAGTLVAGLALWWARRAGLSRRDGGMVALVTAFPNTGFLGLPLLTGLLGTQAAGPLAATMLVDVIWLSSLCLALSNAHGLQHAVQGAVRNPLLWSLGLGLLASACGGSHVLPHALDETVRLLAMAATPAALFTLGAVLARTQRQKQVAAVAARSVWGPALLKLVGHPALVWGIGQGLGWVGWPLPAQGLLVLTMAAALPSASNVVMLAEREGADTGLVARIILWTTVAALLTLVAWSAGLGLAPPAALP